MLPSQFTSENLSPPWHPPCWDTPPEEMVRQSKAQLFEDQKDIVTGALASSDGNAMSGPRTAPKNEAEELLDSTKPTGPVDSLWGAMLRDLKKTEPLPGIAASYHERGVEAARANLPS